MGLFDFIKKKDQDKSPEQKESYLGDLNKTKIIYELIQVQASQRDEKWQQSFLENITKASFRCGEPQVVTGPDGFPYFQLFLPEPGKNFQCYVIEKMKDDFLLNSGFGVVINPSPKSADWVLTYGDILNLHLNKSYFTTEETSFAKEMNDETLNEDEEVMIAQPSETILPKTARKVIADLLKMNGVKNPKILLMMRHRKDGKGVSQDLVFNLTPNNFTNENNYRNMMRAISWYLPRHYSFVGVDEQTFANGFQPL